MTSLFLRRMPSPRPKLVSCPCVEHPWNITQATDREAEWLEVLVRSPCPVRQNGPELLPQVIDSQGCSCPAGGGAGQGGHPPSKSGGEGAGCPIYYPLEKWRGVWGEPIFGRRGAMDGAQ